MEQNRNGIQAFARLSNLIYPRRCPICDGLTGSHKILACGECRQRLVYVREPACKKCGKPLEKEETEYCADCGRRKHSYIRGKAVFPYDRLLRASVARFKYRNRREYADFYAEELIKSCGTALLSWEPDALIPIPLHKSRMRKRGFNQAELVARRIGKSLGIPVETGPLYPYLGNLRPGAPQVEAYAQKALRVLMAQRKGALHTGDEDRAAFLEGLIRQIQEVYLPHT